MHALWAAPAATLSGANPGVNLGSAQAGSTSATTITLTFTFTSSGSIDAPVVLTQGAASSDFADDGSGSCTTNGASHLYNVNDTCTVVVGFKPTGVGLRRGAVQLYSGTSMVATVPIYGVGTGPLAQFPAGGSQTSLGSGFSFPGAVAVDGAGDVFLADLPGISGSIVEITAGGTVQTLVSGLPNPSYGLAVDGAGNVYYTDFGNNTVKEIVAVKGAVSPTSQVTAVGPSILAPEAIAVDALGNLFVTNGINVYEIAAVNGVPGSTAITVGSGWILPFGLAVDSSGNLFVTDDGNVLAANAGTVKEVTPSGGVFSSTSTVTTVAQNLNSPGNLAVDAGENLYVADTGDGLLKEFIATGGVVSTSSPAQTLGVGFLGPNAVVADGQGNFYVSDGGLTSIVKLTLASPPALSFASTAVGSTSTDSPQNVTLQNAGNDVMSVSLPSPSTTSFVLDNSSTNCPVSMQASSTCTIGIDFTPKATGSLSASEVVTDDSLGVANTTQTIALSGTGTPGAASTVTSASSATATYNPASQAVTLSAVVTAAGNPVSTGTVTFTVTSGSTVIGSATTSGALNASGAASVSYSLPAGTTAGSYTIQAVYNPGTGYVASSDSTHQLTIGQATPTVTTAPTATAITYGQTLASSTLSGGAASFGSASVPGSFVFTTPTTAPNAGSPAESVTFNPADSTDYKSASASTNVLVNPAAATVVVTGYTVPYDGSAHTATGTATGIGGANLSADLTLSGTTHTNAGVYSDSWSFTDPNGNYAAQTGSVTDTIHQLTPTIALSSVPGIAYQNGSFTPGLTYSGDGVPSVISQTASVCTVTAGVVKFVGAGYCTLVPSATAGTNYTAATGTAQSFWVTPVEPVSSTSAAITVTATMATAGTLGQIDVFTLGAPNKDFVYASGGTCAAGKAYTAGQTCTVEFTFTPRYPGLRMGAIQIYDNSSTPVLLATVPLSGIGTGPAVVFPSNRATAALGSGFDAPYCVAVDGAGNVYVTSFGNSAVKEIVAGTGSAAPGTVNSSSTVNTIGSGFISPASVAVDGAGNVYVVDFGSSAVKEIVAGTGGAPAGTVNALSTVNTIGSGFNFPSGVAVDGAGNVYVADTNNNAVKEIVAGTGSAAPGTVNVSSTVNTIGSGFNQPLCVAVDAAGNVYVTNYGTHAVQEIVAGTGGAAAGTVNSSSTVNTIGSGFNLPSGIAVDSAGNVYVADHGNNAVQEIVAGTGGAAAGTVKASSTVNTIGSGFSSPVGLAVDGAGNVYVGDYGNNAVKEIALATPPSLTFAGTTDGAVSSAQAVTVQNIGNAPLAAVSPGLAITGHFAQVAGSGTPADCTASFSLASGALCNLSLEFQPQAPDSGAVTGSATLTDNSLNATLGVTQTISLSGTAIAPVATNTLANPAMATFSPVSQTVTLSATVTAGASSVTSGTVTFTVKSASGVIGSATSGAVDGKGNASVSYVLPAATPAGSYTIQAAYNPASSYAASSDSSTLTIAQATPTIVSLPTASAITYGQTLAASKLSGGAAGVGSTTVDGVFTFTSPTTQPAAGTPSESVTFTPTDTANLKTATGSVNITVNKAAPTISLVSSANPAIITSAVTFTATVASTTGTPTGSVSFYDGTTLLGSVAFSNTSSAAYTTSSLSAGTHSITAVYSGDANFISATSSAVAELVQSFTVSTSSGSASTPTQTAPPGQPVTFGFTIQALTTPLTAPVAFSALGMPTGATAIFNPPTVLPGLTPSSFTMTIQTPKPTATSQTTIPLKGAPLVLCLLILPFARKLRRTGKKLSRTMALLLFLAGGSAALLGLNGCGAQSGFFAQQPQTYTITVVGTVNNTPLQVATVKLVVE